jgi:hypothetical protein
MDEPRVDDNGELIVTVEFPTFYGECTVRRRVEASTLDAILNQLDEEGMEP